MFERRKIDKHNHDQELKDSSLNPPACQGEVSWEGPARGGLLHSYNSHRKNYLAQKATRSTQYTFGDVPSFDVLKSELETQLFKLVTARAGEFLPDSEAPFNLTLFGHTRSASATYMGMDSKTGAIRLGFYLHTALAALYHTDASVRESNLRELTSDVDHELRHHRDAEMVAVRSKVLRAILSSEKWSSFYESTAYLSADYLFDLRIEGFAQCDGSCLTLIGRVSDRINLLIQSNPSFFLQQSEMAKAGIQMLGTMAYIDRDSWWQYKARHGFSEYLQSLAIIKVVELSELLRQRGDPPARATDLAENSGYRQQSLYKDYRDSYFSLLDQIANLSSLSEFCDFYLDRAEDLRLKQDELILTPEVVERMKSLDSYFDRSSDAK